MAEAAAEVPTKSDEPVPAICGTVLGHRDLRAAEPRLAWTNQLG